jgi:hypothetical protein
MKMLACAFRGEPPVAHHVVRNRKDTAGAITARGRGRTMKQGREQDRPASGLLCKMAMGSNHGCHGTTNEKRERRPQLPHKTT